MLKKWCNIKLNEETKLVEIYFNNKDKKKYKKKYNIKEKISNRLETRTKEFNMDMIFD